MTRSTRAARSRGCAHSVVDVLRRVAQEAGASPAHVALAWVSDRRGVASTIIGARTLKQLEEHLGALEVKLTGDQLAALDELSRA